MHFTRRLLNTSPSTAEAIAQVFSKHFLNKSFTRTQLLDANQVQKLTVTLNRPLLHSTSKSRGTPPLGTPIPPGYHLVYFTPDGLESELGLDGSDKGFNPQSPFTRRMWAGGKINWTPGNVLRVGQTVTETTELKSAVAKSGKVGGEMIVVGVKKTFENEHGVAVEDHRNWVFMKERPPIANLEALPYFQGNGLPLPQSVEGNTMKRFFQQSDLMLFRFSALTFNGHKIHYSHPWVQQVEGFSSIVVHGPLNLINLLDMWRDLKGAEEETTPVGIEYKAVNPVLSGELYSGVLTAGDDGTEAVMTKEDNSSKVVMKASIR